MNFLLIPDGFRRYARKYGYKYRENYLAGGKKLFRDIEELKNRFDIIGAFPLSRYNLMRPQQEVDALLHGAYDSFSDYLSTNVFPIIILGDTISLIDRFPKFQSILNYCDVNPHLQGRLEVPKNALILYLCYDGLEYFQQVIKNFDQNRLRVELPKWDFVFRTGCENGLFRYSEIFLGTDQSRIACTETLYQEVTANQMITPFIRYLEYA